MLVWTGVYPCAKGDMSDGRMRAVGRLPGAAERDSAGSTTCTRPRVLLAQQGCVEQHLCAAESTAGAGAAAHWGQHRGAVRRVASPPSSTPGLQPRRRQPGGSV